jgi:K+/H+ antiporter YhaU regulatory subunit KhtT
MPNIREILLEKFESKKNDINRNLKYREIKFGNEVKIVSLNFPQSFDSVPLLFIMKEDESLVISEGNLNAINQMLVMDKNKKISLSYKGIQISISETKNIEMYEAFKIDNFNINSFNINEIAVIHNGIKNGEKKPFEYMVIESSFNMEDMINQIKKDKSILEKMISKRILYLGISNNKEVDKSIIDFDGDFIIIGIKSSTFFGKDVSKYCDFENRKDIKSLKTQFEELKSRVASIESRVTLMESRFSSLESRFSSLESRVTYVEDVLKKLVNEFISLNEKLSQFINEKSEKKPDDSL